MPKQNSKSPHRSFHLTYREEIADDYDAPSVFSLVGETFRYIFGNKKIFFGLIGLLIVITILFVGLLSENSLNIIRTTIKSSSESLSTGELSSFASAGLLLISAISTGGLNASLSGGQGIILIMIFLTIFLVSIYVVRFRMNDKKISLRDALYNSMTPLISTFASLMIVLVELIPIIVLVIFYSAAIKTDFLTTPFYALLFLIFAFFMILLSGYLVSSSIVALVATTAPGIYPLPALASAHELIRGRRLKLFFRLVALIVITAIMFAIVMLPIILLDTLLKSCFDFLVNIPAISFFLLFMTFFSFLFSSIYLYLFYRSLLKTQEK